MMLTLAACGDDDNEDTGPGGATDTSLSTDTTGPATTGEADATGDTAETSEAGTTGTDGAATDSAGNTGDADDFTVSQTVFPDGTLIDTPAVQVDFPAGAVNQETEVTVSNNCPAPQPLPAGFRALLPPLCFLPHGLRFAKPVTVTLTVDATVLATLNGTDPEILRANDEKDRNWTVVEGVRREGATFSMTINSFSYYVLVGPDDGGADTTDSGDSADSGDTTDAGDTSVSDTGTDTGTGTEDTTQVVSCTLKTQSYWDVCGLPRVNVAAVNDESTGRLKSCGLGYGFTESGSILTLSNFGFAGPFEASVPFEHLTIEYASTGTPSADGSYVADLPADTPIDFAVRDATTGDRYEFTMTLGFQLANIGDVTRIPGAPVDRRSPEATPPFTPTATPTPVICDAASADYAAADQVQRVELNFSANYATYPGRFSGCAVAAGDALQSSLVDFCLPTSGRAVVIHAPYPFYRFTATSQGRIAADGRYILGVPVGSQIAVTLTDKTYPEAYFEVVIDLTSTGVVVDSFATTLEIASP